MSQTNMPQQQALRILLLEDLPEDAKLIEREVRKILPDYQLHVVDNRADFEQALGNFAPGLILADYLLPQFRGDEALRIVQMQAPDIPFIFVTGTLDNEELAAQTILNGASGFVLKKNITRLPNVILVALSTYSNQQKIVQRVHLLYQEMMQQRYEITQYQHEMAAMRRSIEIMQASLDTPANTTE